MVTPLLDTHGSFATFAEAFPAADEETAKARYPELFDGRRWQLPFRAYLAGSVLIDAAVGKASSLVADAEGMLPGHVDRDSVELVVFTHVHVDHVGWAVDRDGRPFFPGARYVVCEDDWRWAEGREVFRRYLEPLQRSGALELLPAREADVAPGVSIVPTPGHTPGHLCVRIGDTVVLGDVAVHPAQVDDPGLAFMWDEDPEQAAATRSELFASLAESGLRVAAGHFPAPFGTIRRAGDGFQWRPLPSDE